MSYKTGKTSSANDTSKDMERKNKHMLKPSKPLEAFEPQGQLDINPVSDMASIHMVTFRIPAIHIRPEYTTRIPLIANSRETIKRVVELGTSRDITVDNVTIVMSENPIVDIPPHRRHMSLDENSVGYIDFIIRVQMPNTSGNDYDIMSEIVSIRNEIMDVLHVRDMKQYPTHPTKMNTQDMQGIINDIRGSTPNTLKNIRKIIEQGEYHPYDKRLAYYSMHYVYADPNNPREDHSYNIYIQPTAETVDVQDKHLQEWYIWVDAENPIDNRQNMWTYSDLIKDDYVRELDLEYAGIGDILKQWMMGNLIDHFNTRLIVPDDPRIHYAEV